MPTIRPPSDSLVQINDSVLEDTSILLLIQQARDELKAHNGEFKAEWLIEGDLGSNSWTTRNSGHEEFKDGKWRNTINVNFNARMPDGSYLTAPQNKQLLTAAQKVAFLSRNGNLNWNESPRGWKCLVHWIVNLCAWAILHKDQLNPEKHGLALLDQQLLEKLYVQYLHDGAWVSALEMIPRALDTILHLSFEKGTIPAIENPYEIPPPILEKIRKSLTEIKVLDDNKSTISRIWILNKLHIPKAQINNILVLRFFNQFAEIGRVQGIDKREKNSHRKKRSRKGKSSQVTRPTGVGVRITTYCRLLCDAHRHSPSLFPAPEIFDFERLATKAKSLTKNSRHTPVMPINLGLKILKDAIEWVILYGDAIVSATTRFCKFSESLKNTKVKIYDRVTPRREALLSILSNSYIFDTEKKSDSTLTLSDIFKIKKVNGNSAEFGFRSILSAYIGACVICIAFLKPSRIDEIAKLPHDCLEEVIYKGIAYWLNYDLGKSGQAGLNAESQKPIPFISALAISQLQRLREGLIPIFGDSSKSTDLLFYVPVGSSLTKPTTTNMVDNLNRYLDVFCDYTETQTDDLGHRWYVRVHEMRKFFIIMLYWHGRYQVLDAIRWIAGHTSPSHAKDYVESNSPGREICQIEAEYVDLKLLRLEMEAIPGNGNEGLVKLYKDVCSTFRVSKIESIQRKDYLEFLTALRESNSLDIRPYSITTTETSNNSEVSFEIAVRYQDKYDERFYD
ncbi:hypothetical protein IB256_15440 [Pseudomonas sp. PDM17]|uniref:hypothetical protein n=1 Tax=Pseudomonas sp. PDM17 TaxID=2769285 RepID=UPI00177E6ACD|nr:hypothetical protein [Pseudomonas sp. PDM17]MBD9502182.1 hypothetical protein [Pseudomonas sp. PDM17]